MLGALLGDTDVIRMGFSEGATPHAELPAVVGEEIMKWGKAYYTYPVCPAVHMSFYQSLKEHVNTAYFLMSHGADINAYRLPFPGVYRGFPPAIMYSLGLGLPPESSHAAMLERLYLARPTLFNMSAVQHWINITGNPPLLHIPLYKAFFDGLYVLIETFKMDIDSAVDPGGVSALHLAAWLGDIYTIKYLLNRGANPMPQDNLGRLPIHYAAIRGNTGVAATLLAAAKEHQKKNRTSQQYFAMLRARDHHGRRALDLAMLTPPVTSLVKLLQEHTSKYQKSLDSASNDNDGDSNSAIITDGKPHIYPSSTFEYEEGSDSPSASIRGGWVFSNAHLNKHIYTSTIDVVSANELTRDIFYREYFTTQRPVMITDQLTGGSAIWAFWHREDFIEQFGALTVTHGKMVYNKKYLPHAHHTKYNITLTTFVKTYMRVNGSTLRPQQQQQQQQERATYTAMAFNKSQIAQLIPPEVLTTPDLFQGLCGSQDNEPFNLFFGPKHSGWPVHAHNGSWTLLLVGTKTWYFLAPGTSAANLTGVTDPLSTDVISIAEWRATVLPKLKADRLVYQVTQFPGDVVFIPHDWWHATWNHDDTISISQEFCGFFHSDYRFQPLGLSLYGGEDVHRGMGTVNTYYGRKSTSHDSLQVDVKGVPAFI